MKAFIVRTENFCTEKLDKVTDLLSAFDGPLKFFQLEEVLQFPTEFLTTDSIFFELNKLRIDKGIDENQFLCLYTEKRLENNFFTFGDGKRNFVIHSGDWEKYVNHEPEYADAYILYSNILKEAIYKSDLALLFSKLHRDETRGCYMDMCIKKQDILFQLRTADIFHDCLSYIQSQEIDSGLLTQILDAFEGLRKQLLFRKRLVIELKPSRVVIDSRKKFILPEYGNIEFKFSPLRKAIYKLFLDNKNGFLFSELPDCVEELIANYSFFQPNKTKPELSKTIQLVCDPFSDRMHEELSKINAEINRRVGLKLAKFYCILGEKNEKRKIGSEK